MPKQYVSHYITRRKSLSEGELEILETSIHNLVIEGASSSKIEGMLLVLELLGFGKFGAYNEPIFPQLPPGKFKMMDHRINLTAWIDEIYERINKDKDSKS